MASADCSTHPANLVLILCASFATRLYKYGHDHGSSILHLSFQDLFCLRHLSTLDRCHSIQAFEDARQNLADHIPFSGTKHLHINVYNSLRGPRRTLLVLQNILL